MGAIKMCRMCGKLKPTAVFRARSGKDAASGGSSTICLECERIDSRRKYLERKERLGNATVENSTELDKIYKWYDLLRAKGLKPPMQRSSGEAVQIDALLGEYEDTAAATPEELQRWLTCELTEEPDHYIDEVYEHLNQTYRPIKFIDQSTMRSVRDDTHHEVLKRILERFYEYEDTYYDEEDD